VLGTAPGVNANRSIKRKRRIVPKKPQSQNRERKLLSLKINALI